MLIGDIWEGLKGTGKEINTGVLACDRRGCDNIMCDIYVPSVGYVCWECKNEFVNQCDGADIEGRLTLFMEIDKSGRTLGDSYREKAEEFFKQHER